MSENVTTTLRAPKPEPSGRVDAFREELLIKEARQQTRRRRLRIAAVALILLGALLTVTWTFGGGPSDNARRSHGSSGSRALPTLGSTVTNSSLGSGTAIDAVDMVSARAGYAIIANDPFHPHGAVYLAATNNGANSWRFRSALPQATYGAGVNEAVPTVHFVSSSVGYVMGVTTANALFVTTNAAKTWESVRSPGGATSWAFHGSTMALVSQICRGSITLTQCRGELSLYRVGARRPLSTSSIAHVGHVSSLSPRVLTLLSPSSAVVMEGSPGGGGVAGSTAIIQSVSGGATWRQLNDPCPSEGYGDQLITSGRTWILSCFLGEGMNHGKSSLWRSTDGGAQWSLVNRATDSLTTKGDVGTGGGVAMTIAISGDHHVLFGAMGGAIGGVQVSTDGGAHWSSANLDGLGGSSQTLSTFGPRGAIDDVAGGLVYRTNNGRTWSALALLPAGRYHGVPICTSGNTTAVLASTALKGIPGTYPMIFTNHAAHACYLDGPPLVQPESASHHPVGPLAIRNVTFQGDYVIVPSEGTASTSLSISSTRAPNLGGPTSACVRRHVRTVAVRFNPPSSFLVRLPTTLGEVCANLPTTDVNQVIAGAGAIARN